MTFASRYHSTDAQISSEQVHIEQAQKDISKFEVLYHSHYAKIFAFVYQRLDSKEIASDITSQVFLKAMTNISRYENKGLPFSAWLYRIAVNELNRHFRSRKNDRAINVTTDDLHNIMEELEDPDTEERHAKLLALLSDLPEEELQLVEMRYFENMPFREIAEILDITENNAKVRLYRLIDKLKKIM